MNQRIEDLVYQARELRAELHKKLHDIDEQLAYLDKILVELGVYNNPSVDFSLK